MISKENQLFYLFKDKEKYKDKMNKWIILGLLTTLAVVEDVNGKEDDYATKNCGTYDVAWRIAKCASSQSEDGLITDKVFANYLYLALRKLPASSHYTSLGFTTGAERELIFGKQSHYDFDKFKYSFDYDLRHHYFKQALVHMRKVYKKPVLMFVKDIPQGIPAWNANMPGFVHPKGAGSELQLYLSATPSNFLAGDAENCNKFYDWEQRESFEGAVGAAMVMDASMWCPFITDSRFDIVVADVVERVIDGADKEVRFFETNWEINKDGNVGKNLDADYMKVFL